MLFFLSGLLTSVEVQDSSIDHEALARSREQRARGLARVVGEDILCPVDSEDMLALEAIQMTAHIRDALLDGRITLVEARYASRRELSEKTFAQFCLIGRVSRPAKFAASVRIRHDDPDTEQLIVQAEARGLNPRDARLFRIIPLGPPHIVNDYLHALAPSPDRQISADERD